MGYIFLPSQIAEMAMDVEAAGITFYKKLKDYSDNKQIKEIFGFLSVQEAEHRVKFSEIASAMRKKENAHDYSIDVGEMLKYRLEILKQKAFSLEDISKAPIDLKECLDIAIKTEKESINLYTEIYKSFWESFHEPILKIIKEEEKHLEILLNVCHKL